MARLEAMGTPSAESYVAMLEACVGAGDVVRGEYWHQKMLERRVEAGLGLGPVQNGPMVIGLRTKRGGLDKLVWLNM